MNLTKLLKILSQRNCQKVYVKRLAANDNSKNQVYLGGSFDVLNILPIQNIASDDEGDWKRTRFKSKLNFYWVTEDGEINIAPDAQLILYPKYPEVRLSGFLKRARNAPSDLMAIRKEGRILFLGVTLSGAILAYVAEGDSEIGREFESLKNLPSVGVFQELTVINGYIEENPKQRLISELRRIHFMGWIDAKRLNSAKEIVPCSSSNCGGYTLEAELGITPNGYAEPDYLGWEVKQFAVKNFSSLDSSVVTLMTPEPTGGFYVSEGIEAFIRKYGYKDKLGREARLNFGGIYKRDVVNPNTGLTLVIEGFDAETTKIRDSSGYIALKDKEDNIAASWSFTSLIEHWKTKHTNACYVPSMHRKNDLYTFSKQQYCYGNKVKLGTITDFSLFLKQIHERVIYYDPGIKLEMELSGKRKQTIKRRSQFRIKSGNLSSLYKNNEIVDLRYEAD
mgnify:FL=1|jgi:hypothetical protein